MKIVKSPIVMVLLSLILLPCLAKADDSPWQTSEQGSKYSLTPNQEHFVAGQSVDRLPPLPVDLRELDRYRITLEVESSDKEWNEAGIVFGCDELDFHFFLINSQEKYYTYGAHQGKDLSQNWADFIYRVPSDKIDGTSNQIAVRKTGDRIEFYINGNRIAKHKAPTLKGNELGFYMRAGENYTIKRIEVETK